MSENIVVALISLAGSFMGSFGALIAANKLMQYRIEKLEEAVKETAKLTGRVYDLEKHNEVQDEKIKNIEEETDRIIDDIRDMKRGITNAT